MSGPTKKTSKAEEAPETPPQEPQEPQGETTPAGPSQTSQATAAATAAISDVRAKLVAGEQFVLGASLTIVVVSYFIFEILFGYANVLNDFSVLLAVLTVLSIWIHRWGHYDFGKGYRILIGALGVSLGLLALMNLLAWARLGGPGDGVWLLIGRLTYWAAGVSAVIGAWQVFRTREE